MTFSTLILSSLILAGTPLAGAAQAGAPQAGGHRRAVEGTSYPEAAAAGEAALAMDAKDDPGLAMYKSGYELVLAEKWEEARKKLLEMIKNYPSSEYADDAQYWAAYSLMHIDRKKAEEEYKAFIKKYAHSNYYDDAVSDLNSLTTTITVTGPPGTTAEAWSTSSSGGGKGYGYGYSYGRQAERSLRDMERKLRNLGNMRVIGRAPMAISRTPMPPMSPMTPRAIEGSIASAFSTDWNREKLDPETELRVEALYAIGNAKEDEKGYKTLKAVALDFSAARPLREAALDALSGYKHYDLTPIYLEVAKRDTASSMRELAIDFLMNSVRDKNKSVGMLIDLYNSTPSGQVEQRRSLFYFIADVGNDKAVDFLANVARTEKDFDLRKEAVVYLGSIGSERARAALYDILGSK